LLCRLSPDRGQARSDKLGSRLRGRDRRGAKGTHPFSAFQANDDQRKISEAVPTRRKAGLPESGFVFCSFNNSYKINPPVFDVWMRLLKAVSGSVLWLVGDNATVQHNLRREALHRGVEPGRLVFAPRIQYADHLARFRLADLFLDTLPFNAGTTASDALWAGVPVLTCAGEAFASRMAGSLLKAVGLPELCVMPLKKPAPECFNRGGIQSRRQAGSYRSISNVRQSRLWEGTCSTFSVPRGPRFDLPGVPQRVSVLYFGVSLPGRTGDRPPFPAAEISRY